MRILGVCGSLRKASSNLRLLETLGERLSEGIEMVIFDGIGRIPPLNPDLLSRPPLPASVIEWKRALADSNAVLIASPEYGYSIPGALKNAIDWVYGSGELFHKPVAITAAVQREEQGLNGLAALHQTLMAAKGDVFWADTILHDEQIDQQIDSALYAIERRLQYR